MTTYNDSCVLYIWNNGISGNASSSITLMEEDTDVREKESYGAGTSNI